jgi:hypothetical protein
MGDKFNKSYQIGAGEFSFREAVLIMTNFLFKIVRDMVINNKFKYLGKITENGYWPVIANRGTLPFFKTGTNAACSIGWENNAEKCLE